MIRARFYANYDDPRPVEWPIQHPYWVTGYSSDDAGEFAVVVAYADDIEEIERLWPDAREIDLQPASEYVFTGRFPRPDWMDDGGVGHPTSPEE